MRSRQEEDAFEDPALDVERRANGIQAQLDALHKQVQVVSDKWDIHFHRLAPFLGQPQAMTGGDVAENSGASTVASQLISARERLETLAENIDSATDQLDL